MSPSSGAGQGALLARLREEIRRIERRPGRRTGAEPCGLAEVDGLLPAGGFPRGALSDLTGGPASGKTAVALALLARLPERDLFAWVDGSGELYPPAAAARGVDLARLLIVRPPGGAPGGEGWRPALWASEALLASGAFAAVVMDVGAPRAIPGGDAVARRLQAAAEKGGAVALWLGTAGGLRIPAAVRVELSSAGGRLVAARPGAPGPGQGTRPRAGGSGRAA